MAGLPLAPLKLVPGRECGTCTTCCHVLRIEALDKPELTSCRHLKSAAEGGCAIYVGRPDACREFFCGWRALSFVGQHWYPPDCGMMVFPMAAEGRLTVHVDPARAEAWQAAPFRNDLANWAQAATRMGMRLNVMVGRNEVAVLAG